VVHVRAGPSSEPLRCSDEREDDSGPVGLEGACSHVILRRRSLEILVHGTRMVGLREGWNVAFWQTRFAGGSGFVIEEWVELDADEDDDGFADVIPPLDWPGEGG
jgi:hypothetical protein